MSASLTGKRVKRQLFGDLIQKMDVFIHDQALRYPDIPACDEGELLDASFLTQLSMAAPVEGQPRLGLGLPHWSEREWQHVIASHATL